MSEDRQLTIQDVKDVLHTALLEHEIRERANVNEIIQALKVEMFPGGDAYKHNEYHTKKINAAKAEEDFWVSAKKSVVEKGITGLFGVLKIIAGVMAVSLAIKFGITLPGWLMK